MVGIATASKFNGRWFMFSEQYKLDTLLSEAHKIEFSDEQWEIMLYSESENELINQINEADVYNMVTYGADVIKGVFKRLKTEIKDIAQEFQISVNEIKMALSFPEIKEMLKAFGYSIKAFAKTLSKSVGLVGTMCHDLFDELEKYGFADDLDKGLSVLDNWFDNHPLAKKVSGFMVATTLLYIWLSMTFTGRFSSDMNLKNIIMALSGKYSLREIFATPEGKLMLVLFGTGSFVTFPWLGATYGNLMLAVVYTGFMMMNQTGMAYKIKKKIKKNAKIDINP
ncbi:MAG: hypothetical protein CL489_09300 [Acidobacteria bacterium]|nr:hypothetical protein [Acidobacteriota bacterium]|tara:strand:+ start:1854 stop:2699 length:846 start_codon:yes stop_codon:yes gene_type:complete